jgi:seryl-tRNA(Sec) selenium transferase
MEYTVKAHRAGRAAELIPLYQLLAVSHRNSEIARDGNRQIAAKTAGHNASVIATQDTFGGGAAPGKTIPGWGARIETGKPDELARRARDFTPPIIAIVADNGVVFSLRTMFESDDQVLINLLSSQHT